MIFACSASPFRSRISPSPHPHALPLLPVAGIDGDCGADRFLGVRELPGLGLHLRFPNQRAFLEPIPARQQIELKGIRARQLQQQLVARIEPALGRQQLLDRLPRFLRPPGSSQCARGHVAERQSVQRPHREQIREIAQPPAVRFREKFQHVFAPYEG